MSASGLLHWINKSAGVTRPILVTAVLALLALVLNQSQMMNFGLWSIYGLLTLSLFLIWGHMGMLTLGQGAFFGLAGYTYGALSINLIGVTGECITSMLIAVALAATFAAMLGYFLFYGRVSGLYFTITTLVVTLVLYTFAASTANPRYAIGDARLGGYNGMTGIPEMTVGIPGLFELSLGVKGIYVFAVLATGAFYIFLKFLLRTNFGRVIAAVRENELRTELLGYDVRLFRLLAFILSGAIAGFAGVLYTAWGIFINPAVFSLSQAAIVVIWLLVGGRSTMLGALLGVIVVQSATKSLGGITHHTPIFLGLLFIMIVLFFPNGLVPSLESAWNRFKRGRNGTVEAWLGKLFPQPTPSRSKKRVSNPHPLDCGEGEGAATVEIHDLGVSFGGLEALAGVTLRFTPGLHCLIGPNGAGKSTFFNLVVGRVRATKGYILYNGKDLARLKLHQRARLGIGMKTQVPSIYNNLSVEENVWLGAYALLHDRHQATVRAHDILQQIGLPLEQFSELAVNLSHGEQQLLEVAMVLASGPKLILLDEPSAGMTREESGHIAHLLSEVAKSATVVVVEHSMEFVRQLHADVTVFHQGKVFAKGSLEELRQNKDVINIYLGRDRRAAG